MLKLAKCLDFTFLIAGAAILCIGLARVGLTACLVGGGLALLYLGIYGKRGQP